MPDRPQQTGPIQVVHGVQRSGRFSLIFTVLGGVKLIWLENFWGTRLACLYYRAAYGFESRSLLFGSHCTFYLETGWAVNWLYTASNSRRLMIGNHCLFPGYLTNPYPSGCTTIRSAPCDFSTNFCYRYRGKFNTGLTSADVEKTQ